MKNKLQKLRKRFGSRFYLLPKRMAHDRWFRLNHDDAIHWEDPQTFDEKLHWLMVYAYGREEAHYADKLAVRQYVRDCGFAHMLTKLYGVWDNVRDIDLDTLPDRFVLKTNHASGGDYYTICKDKSQMNWHRELAKLDEGMHINFARQYGEYHYAYIKPRIFAEELLEDGRGACAVDYKVHCFSGVPHCILVCSGRGGELTLDNYSVTWEKLDYSNCGGGEHPKPESLDQMLEAAAVLSGDLPFARVDFYDVAGKAYFGEITLTPAAGCKKDLNPQAQKILGQLLVLPREKRRK